MADLKGQNDAVHQSELKKRLADVQAQHPGEVLSPEEYAEALGVEEDLAIDNIRQALAEPD